MKHIVIDARIIESSTGVYVQRLIHFMYEIDEENQYTILMPGKTIQKWRAKYPRFGWVEANQKSYSFAEQLSFAWQLYGLKADLVHFTMPQQPLLYVKRSVTTVHDTTLVRFENVDMNVIIYKIRKFIFAGLLTIVTLRSKRILVPTEFVKKDLMHYVTSDNHKKYVVTLEAGDPSDEPPEAISFLENTDYLCFVGNAFPYKNVRRTIYAYAELKKTYPHLKLAFGGKKDFFYNQHEQYVIENGIADVHFMGFISDGEKRWLYQNARAMVTASLSEGFCIPVIEAMYEECPVVSSNATCLPEVAGDAALYFNPHSTEDLVEKLTELLENSELRQELIAKGNLRVKDFSWKRMATETLVAYENSMW